MARVEELLSVQELINYTKTRKLKETMGDLLFPTQKIEGLEIKMIKGASNLPVSASVHAFDTEAEIASREGANLSIAELALVKRKIKLDEKDIIVLEEPRNSQEETQMINQIFNDVDNLVSSVNTRIEAMRMEVLSTGELNINENGVKASLKYGTPTNHKETKTWSSGTPDILGDIYNMTDKIVVDTGFTPTRSLTSKTILNIILRDEKLRKAIFGVNSDKLLTLNELNTFLVSQSLPPIFTYDERYRVQGKDGKYTTKRFLDENKFILMPDGKMGDTFFGLTAEELELRKNPAIDISSVGNIIVEQYSTADPVAKWIKAVATALPSFPYADQVFMGTIN
ncbi:TPA: major capsid protein [Clostridioides difficile]|uniref:Major capsid protein E n=2 Tax=Clostridioides difficile TaxID=1496 RepID=A0AC59FV57_CLODI|nr:major capsid protein [Clostridioides difficile]DAN94421.1 MAG TPA: major capsid protein [Bacteriophage sp.]AKP41269.1 major capsid protein E [Clostridioides difficile ATCC 9689 = DSM 1296]ARC15065.1 minor capsid protein E [Clostridioides difficile]AVI10882.1 minor capsid protein E [Clostridioides difficile]EAA0001071.1 capsid protein [Clostridioides difficile]